MRVHHHHAHLGRRGAGTDANVTLALVGKDEGGNRVAMGPFPLETSADDFKRGATDTFRAEGPFMATIVSATVAHDALGSSAARTGASSRSR